MGTKVEYTRDLIEDANICWSPFYEPGTHTGCLYNGFMLKRVDYFEFDREMLRRTMLEHESTFRKQVYELHRLYSIQKNLMNEIRRNGFPRSVASVKAPPFSSKVQSHDSKRMQQQQPFFPLGNAGIGHFGAPLNSLEESHQLAYTSNMKHNEYPQTNLKCSSQIKFDLELPADAYIQSENTELLSYSSHNFFPLQPENDLKLGLRKGYQSLVLENEPIGQIEGSSTTQNVPPHSFLGCQSPVLENGHKHRGASENIPYEDLSNVGKELVLFRNESGKSTDVANSFNPQLCYEKIPVSSAASILRVNKSDKILSSSQSKESWLTKSKNSTSCFLNARQTLPCFTIRSKNDMDEDFRTSSTSVSEVTSYPNGISNGFLLVPHKHSVSGNGATSDESKICYNDSQCGDNKSMKDFDLNQVLPNGIQMEIFHIKNNQILTDTYQLMGSSSEMGSGVILDHSQLWPSFTGKSNPRIELDLNFAVECEECTEGWVSSHEENNNITLRVDLEAPLWEQVEDNVLVGGKSHIGKTDSSDFVESSEEVLLNEAAKNIVAMSLEKQTCLQENLSLLASFDELNWFANLAVDTEFGKTDSRSSQVVGESEVFHHDELESFEHMTLKLQEIKVDVAPQVIPTQEIRKEEEKSAPCLLLAKPRRGQAKKRRRQRKDFQKDILPGLVSLSRHEVTEDLQTIGALGRASGRSWQTNSLMRNKGRRQQTQPKASKGIRCQSTGASDVYADPHPTQPKVNTECKIDVDIIGWGRRRRCRRQRCPPSNIHLPNLKAKVH